MNIKKLLCLACLMTLGLGMMSLAAQKKDPDRVVKRADVMPAFPGCDVADQACTKQKMMDYVRENLTFPKAAKAAEVGGLALVSFTVEKNGSFSNVHLLKDPGHGMGAEAMRVVEAMGGKKMKWTPGREDGEKMRVQMTLPVSFSMDMPEKVGSKQVVASSKEPEVYDIVEEMPRFAGCDTLSGSEAQQCTFKKLIEYIQADMKYPAAAKAEKVEGRVLTSFIVSKEGKITDAEILEGLHEACDQEALRLVKAMPTWLPGKKDGKEVNVRMKMPFQFQMSKATGKE